MAEVDPSANTPPVTNPVTSPATPATPSQPSTEVNAVTLSKEEYDKLNRDAAVAKSAQQNASQLQTKLDALSRRKVAPLPPLEAQAVATVRNQVTSAVLTDSKYSNLLQKNPLLAKVLAKNPLDLLDRDEFLDEEDATNQVLDFLDAEAAKATLETTAPPAPAAPPTTTAAPAPQVTNPGDPVQPTNTPSEKEKKDQEERNKNLPVMDRLANNIASRINIS